MSSKTDLKYLTKGVFPCPPITKLPIHITGLGKKTFLLLPKGKGRLWYWSSEKKKSIWYPSIEVVEQKNDDVNPDKLWGLAWEVESIKEAHERLTNDGIEITEVKKGIKENTLVATIKSHTNNVPTLLIEHLS